MTLNVFTNVLVHLEIDSIWDFIKAIIDIAIITYVVYKAFYLMKETRAWQLLKGLVFILIAAKLTEWVGFRTLAFILNNTIQYIALALVILFQPELRRALEQIGRSRFKNIFVVDQEVEKIRIRSLIEEIVTSIRHLSETKTGALIVIERDTKLGDVISTGTSIDANVSSELIENVFVPNTPLHDGALIIRRDRIMAAACYLPLTENSNLSKELGTRHRAALGISEISDSITLVVSEETGKISFAVNGGLSRNLNSDTLRKALNTQLITVKEEKRKINFWRSKIK